MKIHHYGQVSEISVKFPQDPFAHSKYLTRAMPYSSQYGPLCSSASKIFFESNLNFKGVHGVIEQQLMLGLHMAGTSVKITFGEKGSEATLKGSIN